MISDVGTHWLKVNSLKRRLSSDPPQSALGLSRPALISQFGTRLFYAGWFLVFLLLRAAAAASSSRWVSSAGCPPPEALHRPQGWCSVARRLPGLALSRHPISGSCCQNTHVQPLSFVSTSRFWSQVVTASCFTQQILSEHPVQHNTQVHTQ